MHYDVIIVGAGPGGLACGAKLAARGLHTLIIERKAVIGPKSCAGGITWSGLIGQVPTELVERSFSSQYVKSKYQDICITADTPIIATVSREKLGQYMAQQAQEKGVQIRTSTDIDEISENHVALRDLKTKKRETVSYSYLVGGDGSSSKIRRHLEIPVEKFGIGINYQLENSHDKMEWHLNSRFFDNGYGWIFPHRNSISIGAYTPRPNSSAVNLKKQLHLWASQLGFELANKPCSAGYINYDYRGHAFNNIYLIGDAAGLASALTGEGIYPAIVSGVAVAEMITGQQNHSPIMDELLKRHRRFVKMVEITGKNDLVSTFLAEVGVLGLRLKLIDFTMLEMAK